MMSSASPTAANPAMVDETAGSRQTAKGKWWQNLFGRQQKKQINHHHHHEVSVNRSSSPAPRLVKSAAVSNLAVIDEEDEIDAEPPKSLASQPNHRIEKTSSFTDFFKSLSLSANQNASSKTSPPSASNNAGKKTNSPFALRKSSKASVDSQSSSVVQPKGPKIKNPGPLPEGLKLKNNDEDRTEDEDKAIRRRIILALMRGQLDLPSRMKQKYQLLDVLGDGAFGFVFAAKIKGALDKEAAIKFIIRDKVPENNWVFDDEYGYVPFEAHFLRQVNHPNLVRFLDLFYDDSFYYLVTELHGTAWTLTNPLLNPIQNPGIRTLKPQPAPIPTMLQDLSQMRDSELLKMRRPAYDLFECIDAHRKIPDQTAKKIFAQIVKAIEYLESIGFVHRDLKDENIVVDQFYNIKLIDFGSASRIPENESSYFTLFNGTLHFASPEYVKHIPVKGPEAEVWTMGVVLYTIVFGENPFHTTEDVLKYNIKFPEENTECLDLIKKCLDREVKTRITLDGIKKHPWVATCFENAAS